MSYANNHVYISHVILFEKYYHYKEITTVYLITHTTYNYRYDGQFNSKSCTVKFTNEESFLFASVIYKL